jgi:hypothetical protein
MHMLQCVKLKHIWQTLCVHSCRAYIPLGSATLRNPKNRDPRAILMTPRVNENIPNADLRRRIGIYFHDVLGTNFCLLYLKSSSAGAGYKLSMGTPLEQLQRWPMYGSVREVNLFNLHLEIIHSMKLKSRSAARQRNAVGTDNLLWKT